MTYKQIKHTVLVVLLGSVCFLFGYLYFGSKLANLLHGQRGEANHPGPPAPVMQELANLRSRIARNPKDEAAYTELGHLFFEANKFQKALSYYEKAVALDGSDIVARNDLALCYHIAGRDKEAFEQLDAALRISPRSQHLLLTLGLVDYETGNVQRARIALKEAYQIDPQSEAGKQAQSMLFSLDKKTRS